MSVPASNLNFRTMGAALRAVDVQEQYAQRFDHIVLPFDLRPHQYRTLKAIMYWNRVGVFDEARCLPGDAEFLTPTGWKFISEYEDGDLVGQVDKDTREVTFVPPQRYVKTTSEKMVYFGTKKGKWPVLEHLATPDHKVLAYHQTYHRDGTVSIRPVDTTPVEILNGELKTHHFGLANTFSVDRPGMLATENDLRLMVAVIADGYFPNKSGTVYIRLKKERKKSRLEALLNQSGREYTKSECLPEGFHVYRFKAPWVEKTFGEKWWDCSAKQLKAIIDEAEHWDGSRQSTLDNATGKKTAYQFSTGSKESADFIQYAAAASGRTAALGWRLRERDGRKSAHEYWVTIRDKENLYFVEPHNLSVVDNEDPENKVYCFTVPTGYFITRYRGRIVLTGNCGKTMPMQLAATYFSSFGYKSIFLMPPILFLQFQEEFNRIQNHGLTIKKFTDSPAARAKLLKSWSDSEGASAPDVLICTKEIFKKHVKELLYARYKALFFDECHMGLQSWGMLTKKKQLTTYGAVTHFVEALPHGRLVLSTGTPASNELETAWGIISLKSPQLYESKAHFDADHVTYKQIKIKSRFRPGSYMTRSIVDHENYRNLDKLHTSLYHQSVRALKLDVLDIKKPNIQEVDIRLSKPHQKAYTDLVKNKVLEFGENQDKLIDARNASKLRQLCMQGITNPGILTSKPVGNSVFELVDALLESLDVKHNKVLLFANYRQTVRNLAEHLKRLNPGTVYGENSPAQNSEHVQRFKNTDLCRVLISNPIAGGVGLTLGHVCQAVIIVEPISTPGQFDQALSRTVLSGQKEPVVVYIVRVLGTISPSLTDLMKGKLIRNEEVLQDGQSLVDELLGRR